MSISNFVFENPDFKEMYEFSQTQEDIIQEIKNVHKNYIIQVFASKTCQYCRIHIPHLLRIYDDVKFSLEFIVWEDYSEDERIELMDQYSLLGLPTIIIYRLKPDKKEIGRITKEPINSLEEDLLAILQKI